MPVSPQILGAGFGDAVTGAQATFRALLDALAGPGTLQRVSGIDGAPAPLSPVAAAVALTLCDADTPVWLGQNLGASAAVKDWFAFHTGAPLAAGPAEAHFAFCPDPQKLPALEMFAQGTQEYPDRSTTLVLQVPSFASGEPLALEGPGIDGRRTIAPHPLPLRFREQWRQNRNRFPRGIDLVLAGPEGVIGLPRTTRIVEV